MFLYLYVMKRHKATFKPYYQNQLMALPPTFDELIPENHPVRIVNQVLDQIDLTSLYKKYQGGGSSSYHPRMLLKVLVYGYLCNIYSSRKIEAAIRENIHFMWLAGMEKPEHNTINRFRTERLEGVIKKIFTEVVLLMAESGHVDLQSIYTDGTKIEANANRYTFVWGKKLKTNKARILSELEELWNYTQEVAAEELKDTAPTSFEKMNPEEVRKTIDKIDDLLKDKPLSPEMTQRVKKVKKELPKKIEKNNDQLKQLGDRNSYSKTDPDATFMRMKEDHFGTGLLKPAYNTQISTNNQIITHFSIHQNPGDTTTLIEHMTGFKECYGFFPGEITADAGYGSEENYEFLEQNNVDAYVKYSYFDREQSQHEKAKPAFHPDNLFYNKELNCYYCPMGQPMVFAGTTQEITDMGYVKELSKYQAQNCRDCPVHAACHKSKENRIIEVSHRLNELKAQARERLLSEKGLSHRSQRPIDVEPVFGMIKHNRGRRRFELKGIKKVYIEFGLIALAHNIAKMVN